MKLKQAIILLMTILSIKGQNRTFEIDAVSNNRGE
jgi:hypothetical protein